MTNKEPAQALQRAADIFRDYERIHLAKNPPDRAKAERNGEYAYEMEQALEALTDNGKAEGDIAERFHAYVHHGGNGLIEPSGVWFEDIKKAFFAGASQTPQTVDLRALKDELHEEISTGFIDNVTAGEAIDQTIDHLASRGLLGTVVEWRDISTAPKDGTQFLIWTNRVGFSVVSHQDNEYVTPDELNPHGFYLVVDEGKHGPFPLRGDYPTHWQPLPASPQPKTQNEKG